MNALDKTTLDRIKSLRNQKRISQTKMAEMMGISQTGYAKIENGTTESVSLPVAVAIAKALTVGFNELFDIDGDSSKIEVLNKQIEELQEKIEELKERINEKDKIQALQDQVLKNFKNSVLDSIYYNMSETEEVYRQAMAFLADDPNNIIEDKDDLIKTRKGLNKSTKKALDYLVGFSVVTEKEVQQFYRRKKESLPDEKIPISDIWDYYDKLDLSHIRY